MLIFFYTITISAQYYSNIFQSYVYKEIQKKRSRKKSKVNLLHDSACPHAADFMRVTLPTTGWEVLGQLPLL
jgi:hypothetical protein